MEFKLKIERAIGGYILTVEKPDGVERIVIGLDQTILTTHGIIGRLDEAVGHTILQNINFKSENELVLLDIDCLD